MKEVEYHIHVNALGEELPDVLSHLCAKGYAYKPAKIFIGHTPYYLGLYSLKPSSHKLRDNAFDDALQFVRAHPTFTGYVESESISMGMVTEFAWTPFTPTESEIIFPIPEMVPQPKCADVHVYIPLHSTDVLLTSFLIARGFYEVHTPSKKIFTLELESMADAKKMYTSLTKYFSRVGGVIEVECESVGRLEPARSGFTFRNVAAKGSASDLKLTP